MKLKLYQLLTKIASPLIGIYLLKRMKKGKEDPLRFRERFGEATTPRPQGKLIWVHGASVGESLSVLPLIEKIAIALPDAHFLLTTGTVSSAKLLADRLPTRTIHQYIPIDTLPAINGFLNHWRPDLTLWLESELWPNLVTQTSKRCKMLLINGRMSERSYAKWQKHRSLCLEILGCFSAILPWSKGDGERFTKLGGKNIDFLGNIKYDAPPLPDNPEERRSLSVMIGDRPLWLAASTHQGEEEIIAAAHKKLKEKYPELLTIIAPRHPKRAAEIIRNISSLKLHISLRSAGDEITHRSDIYLADTMGELGMFFTLAPIVLIGNSLVGNGGHNPLEPARCNCAIIYGVHMENFTEITDELAERNAAITVTDVDNLIDILDELFSDKSKIEKLATAADVVVREKNGVLDAYTKKIVGYIT
jgi:3-deoxy-D-manno-octulosonic-acid transferase